MEKINISINDKKYTVKIADTYEDKEKGLQDIETLPENEGMLFVFDPPEDVSFWMKDTKIPLDIIFIDEDLEVIKVSKGEPNSEELHEAYNVAYVLEVNTNSGIVEDDELEFETEDSIKDNMYILDENGEVQMTLEGGERIFSRPDTKKLIKFAKKANRTKKESDYRLLSNRLFKFIDVQENNKPEYVEGK